MENQEKYEATEEVVEGTETEELQPGTDPDNLEETTEEAPVEEKSEVDTVIQIITVPLTEEDKVDLGKQMSELSIAIERIEAEKKRTVENFNATIKENEAELLAKAKTFHEGTKEEEYECVVRFNDPEEKQKSYYEYVDGSVGTVPLLTKPMNDSEIKRFEEPELFDGDDEPEVYENESEEKLLKEFGFSPWEVVNRESTADWFIADNPSDLEEHDIAPGEITEVQGCMLVKCSYDNVKEVLAGPVKYKAQMQITKALSWWVFPPLETTDDSYEVVDDEENSEGQE